MYNTIRNTFAYASLVLINYRFFIGDILRTDTSNLTILIAFVNLLAIDYRHFKYIHYLVIACFLFLTRDNPAALPIIFTFITCIVCKDISLIKAARICLVLQLLFLLYMYWNVLADAIKENTINYEKGVTRDLGFGNSNTFATFIFSILCTIYLSFKNMNKTILISIFIIISLYTYHYSISRTVLIGTNIMILSILFHSQINNVIKNSLYRKIISSCPIIFISIVIFLILSILEFEKLNEILTGRLMLWLEYFIAFLDNNVLFGADLVPIIQKPLDNSYINLLVSIGIIGYAIFSFLFYKAYKCNHSLMFKYQPLVFAILACGFTESILLSCYSINILFLLMIYKSYVKINH